MSKALLFLLALIAGVLVSRTIKAGQRARRDSIPPPSPKPVERMRACRLCGLHVPEVEAVQSGGHFYCCEDHRRRGQ